MDDSAQLAICFISSRGEAPEIVDTLPLLESWEGPLGVDTETTGLNPITDRVRLVQVASPDFVLVLDLDAFRQGGERLVDWRQPGLRELRALLVGPRPKVLQNAAFDLNFLRGEGINLGGPIFDTMIASKINNNGSGNRNGLGEIVSREIGGELPKELQKADWSAQITAEMVQYAARDAAVLPRLVEPLRTKLQKSRVGDATLWDIFELECMCLRPIALMQWHGFAFDRARGEELLVALQAKADGLMQELLEFMQEGLKRRYPKEPAQWLPLNADGSFNTNAKEMGSIRLGTKRYAGFNARSPLQMIEKLTALGLLLPINEKGKPSLDQNLLAFLRQESELVEKYLTWKESATQVTHIEKLLASVGPDGRIHASYRQVGTDTGRLSCAEPNLQQVPRDKEFRSLFVAKEGYKIVVADFSQIELRVAAELSEEPRMLEAYRAGRDLHTETAALITQKDPADVTKDDRTSAKMCFSGDTEVLTESGWVRLDAYNNERVAQYVLPAGVALNRRVRKPGPGYVAGLPPAWDGNCGAIEFVEPLHYDGFLSEDVWRVVDRNIDIVATGNHQILYLDAYGNAWKKAFSEVVAPRELIAAGYCAQRPDCLSVTDSRLLAMVVADGSFKQTAGWVSLGFSKRRKIKRCGDLLEEAGIAYKQSTSSNGSNEPTTFFKFKLDEAPWLLDYVDKNKVLNHAACIGRVDALAYLCEAQYWDGIALGGAKRDRVIVGTTVRETADVMQAMAVTAGLPCTVHTEENPACAGGLFYRVSYAFRTTPTWRPSWAPERVEAQQVYCVQVPSELIVIRRNGKVCVQGNCNFGLLYGAGAATLRKQAAAQYGVNLSLKEAQQLVTGFREAYPKLYQWQVDEGEGTTTAVFTRYGRRRILIGFNDKFTTRINTQVQGTAGDIAKIAIAKLWQHLKKAKDEARLIAMCHDEIVLEVRNDVVDQWSATLQRSMEEAGSVVCKLVPIVAEASSGDTWAEAK